MIVFSQQSSFSGIRFSFDLGAVFLNPFLPFITISSANGKHDDSVNLSLDNAG